MKNKPTKFTRREFIGSTVKGTIGLVGFSFLGKNFIQNSFAADTKSTVVVVKNNNVLINNKVQKDAVQSMVDTGIRKLTGIDDIGEAWKSIFPGITKDKIISIKVNCVTSSNPTHPEVTYSVANGLTSMIFDGSNFPAENIIIWDNFTSALRSSGYSINYTSTGIKCFGTDRSGVGYDSTVHNIAGSNQRLSKIVTNLCDYIVNLSILKNHDWGGGVTLSLKNHYGSVDYPDQMHNNYCDPYIPILNNLAPIKNKQVISICDGILGVISGGPLGLPQVTPKCMIFSKDPVAHDYIGAQILKQNGMRDLFYNRATHITTAANAPYSLGTNNPDNINLIEKDIVTEVKEGYNEPPTPDSFKLFHNYPNPFNPSTTISYQLFKPFDVKLNIFDIRGKLVRELVNENQGEGYYRISWNGKTSGGRTAASDIYLAKLQLNDLSQVIKMQLIK